MKSNNPLRQIPRPHKKIFIPIKMKYPLDKSKKKNKKKKTAH